MPNTHIWTNYINLLQTRRHEAYNTRPKDSNHARLRHPERALADRNADGLTGLRDHRDAQTQFGIDLALMLRLEQKAGE